MVMRAKVPVIAAIAAVGLAGLGLAGWRVMAPPSPEPTEAAAPAPPSLALRRGDLPFDFYVLALSWSPSWCAAQEDPDPAQCRGPRRYGFVVHGLWPQFERGFPRACETDVARPEDATFKAAEAIYPSPRLARLQWERHGTCSGLPADIYFDATRAAAKRVAIPPQFIDPEGWQRLTASDVEDAFIASNPGLDQSGLAVQVRDGKLREVRVCLTKDLTFRSCEEVDGKGDTSDRPVQVPPVRP